MLKSINSKRFFSFILTIAMLFCTFTIFSEAATYTTGTYKVSANSGVNVRNGAGTNYSIAGASAKGTTFTVSKISGSWGFTSSVKCTNGTRSGWICLDNCSKQSSSQSVSSTSSSSKYSSGNYAVTANSGSNIRSGAGTGYSIVGAATKGTAFNVSSVNGSWGYTSSIKTTSGYKSGWICLDYCAKQSSPSSSSSTVAPTGVGLSYSSFTITMGDSKTITATVYPSNATNKTVTWSSSDSSVATVNGGKITAKKVGSATITVKTTNGRTSTCTVKVTGVKTSDITYKYVNVNLDTSSMENWIKSVNNIESKVCGNASGVIIGAKVTKWTTVSWKVAKTAIYQGPGITGYQTVKYTVPATVQYQVHSHTRNNGFGKSWYYANQCIVVVYTCDCGYRREIMEWEIPLPDFSDAQTTQKVIQGLPKIN